MKALKSLLDLRRRWLSPCTNVRICSYCSLAWLSFTRSILFCRMRMCFSFMISMAARCSDVCGCGHDSLPAGRSETLVARHADGVEGSPGETTHR